MGHHRNLQLVQAVHTHAYPKQNLQYLFSLAQRLPPELEYYGIDEQKHTSAINDHLMHWRLTSGNDWSP
ncbi:hypothetical protein Mapa_000190 [Marchantia paleacea]|nr:hypothetical protein Mapa_000190 [Marchantia paleacea]